MNVDVEQLALRGANLRIAELRDELVGLEAWLGEAEQRLDGREPQKAAEGLPSVPATVPVRRPMTAAQRKAVSARMRRYWAARKAGKP